MESPLLLIMVLFHLMILHLVIKQSKVAILGMNSRELKSEHARLVDSGLMMLLFANVSH